HHVNSIREARTPRPAFNLAAVLGARQRRRTLIGLLIMSVIFVVAVLIFLMDPLRRALRDEVELVALFDSAPSIGRGAAVWIAGHEAGRVETLEFLPLAGDTSPRLALLLRIPRDRLPMLRADATVRISSASVAGDPAVDILPGNADAPPLQPGDTLRAEPTLTRAELRQRVARVRAASDSLRMESRPLAAAARERMIGLARVQTRFARVQARLDELSRTLGQSPLTAFTASDDVGRALERLPPGSRVVADERGAGSGRHLPSVPRSAGGPAWPRRRALCASRTASRPRRSPVRLRQRRGAPAHPSTARLTARGRTGKPVRVRVLTSRRPACPRVRDGGG